MPRRGSAYRVKRKRRASLFIHQSAWKGCSAKSTSCENPHPILSRFLASLTIVRPNSESKGGREMVAQKVKILIALLATMALLIGAGVAYAANSGAQVAGQDDSDGPGDDADEPGDLDGPGDTED